MPGPAIAERWNERFGKTGEPFASRNPFPPVSPRDDVGGLTPEVAWTGQAKKPGEGNRYVGWSQGVSVTWLQTLWKRFRETGEIPILKPAGRPWTPFTKSEARPSSTPTRRRTPAPCTCSDTS